MRKWSGCRVLSGNRCGGTQVSRTGWWPRPSCFSSRCSDVPADFGMWKRRSVGFGNRVSAAIATTPQPIVGDFAASSRAPPSFGRTAVTTEHPASYGGGATIRAEGAQRLLSRGAPCRLLFVSQVTMSDPHRIEGSAVLRGRAAHASAICRCTHSGKHGRTVAVGRPGL